MTRHTIVRVAARYVSGRPLDGRSVREYPYLSRGAGRWPGWQRQAARLGVPATAATTAYAATAYTDYTRAAGVTLAVVAARAARRRWARRRFRRAYLSPTLAALSVPLGGARVRLHVDPGLGTLMPRLAKPLSPAEVAVRRWYGQRVEPVLRWPVDRAMRAWWTLQRACRPATQRLAVFRRPGAEDTGPRIDLTIDTPYLTDEQRKLVSSIVRSKIPAGELVESWDQVGASVSARWTVRRRPPSRVGLAELLAALPKLAEWEFYLGASVGEVPVILSLKDDSPHIAVSAGSGAGKSVLAQLVAVQVLARGGRVVILGRKGSHRWALGLAGVDYCHRPEQMHQALIRAARVADERNTLAMHEADDWDPGPRTLVICEELNATIGQLTTYWADTRGKSDPKRSPAVTALGELLFMGRSAKINVLAIAQMLTARAIGGPEARENFGVRCLARYTANAWKMLVPEAAMPRASRTLGRWQIVIGGVATECQVAYLTRTEARAVAAPVHMSAKDPDGPLTSDVHVDVDTITLREAADRGVIPWSVGAAQKRLQRDREHAPTPCGTRGRADLYRVTDLIEWVSGTLAPYAGDAS
ncbi:DUF87 domain-containing protein [Dactylosporangium vinaceum]|uniref:Helicase HerA domain-containing protein n=1 Tax=Dactylosporangium vinaceum TaxID=53362 RepID=A0ABV5MLS1_9ACTN|nr:DUF87 domain-containing protein [Dactylosporangium vinaceum]UAB96916.1 DUF87 domain-containing protein [Dactylosporangium vinaceum]